MTSYVPIAGSERALPPNSRPAGPIDPKEIASVTVRVRSQGDPKVLAAKVAEFAGTPQVNRQYLTQAELEQQHGASVADLDAVERFSQPHSLTVVNRSAA